MKKIIVGITVLVVIVGGVLVYFHQNRLSDFEPLIKLRLNRLVEDASNGLYHLDIEKLNTNMVNSKLTIINAHLRADSARYAQLEQEQKAPNDLFDVYISQLSLDNIRPVDFLSNKAIRLQQLFIGKPLVKVWHKKQPYNLPAEDSSVSIFQRLRPDITSVKIDTIILRDVDFIYTNRSRRNKQTRLNNMNFFFTDILLDSSTQYDKQRFLFARNGLISMENYSVNTGDGLYRFSLGKIQVQTNTRSMQLKDLKFIPRLSTTRFYEHVRRQQDRFSLTATEIDFENIDWWAMLAEESFSVRRLTMKKGKCIVYNDKSLPPDGRSKLGKYPHQMLMKLPFLIKLDTINLGDLDVSYTEKNPKSGGEGTIYFDNIHGTITNVTNDSAHIGRNRLMKITAGATFMKQAPFNATMIFDLARYKKGDFSVTGSIGAMNGAALNTITVPLALLKVNQVQLKSLDIAVRGDNDQASGTVKMIYDDLSITVLKKGGDTARKRGLLNFIANNFIIKKSNPTGNRPVRVEQAVYKRDMQKSFFNLVWKTILTGAGKTVGYNKK